jgi:quercetin dioxygenase-like cupin family protein
VTESQKVLRVGEQQPPAAVETMAGDWLRGPHQDDGLDVAVIHFAAGAATPRHIHHGGQVLVALSGEGFVEVEGVRTTLARGDIVVTPAGQEHSHGATTAGDFSHLSVTTGRNELLSGDVPYPSPAVAD